MEEKVLMTINGKNEQEFLKSYHHSFSSVSEIGLNWAALVNMHDYYCSAVKDKLEISAQNLFMELKNIPGAYVVRYRVKDPEHVIDKAIRKKIDKGIVINKENFLDEFDDFIGVRILHLFKNDWEAIYNSLREKYDVIEQPKAYHREGDSKEYLEKCKELGLNPEIKEAGYRSIHYLAKIPFFGSEFKCEIQVRTIFEEAWSEIDHLVRYPNDTNNELLNYYLLMFNRIAGCADEMGSFVMTMKTNMTQMQKEREQLLEEVASLKGANAKQNKKIDELMEKLEKKSQIGWPFISEIPIPSTIDYISAIQNPSGSTIDSIPDPYKSLQESMERLYKSLQIDDIKKLPNPLTLSFKMPKPNDWRIEIGDEPEDKENDKDKE